LIAIVLTAVLIGIGHSSRDRLANVNSGFANSHAIAPASVGGAGSRNQ
jgi:hypothetical protein